MTEDGGGGTLKTKITKEEMDRIFSLRRLYSQNQFRLMVPRRHAVSMAVQRIVEFCSLFRGDMFSKT